MGLHICKNAEAARYYDAKLQREFDKHFYTDEYGYLVERERNRVIPLKTANRATSPAPRRTGHKQCSEGTRSSAASGDGNSDDPDPETERNPQHPLYLFDQQSLADLLCIAKKTLQNTYSNTPHELPAAIQIPHARGPRWTIQAVQDWLANRPKHTQKLAPVVPKRKAGRPRIAQVVAKGGAK